MAEHAIDTRSIAEAVAANLNAAGPRTIDIDAGSIIVWQAYGDDHQPIVVQYHQHRDALRVNHGTSTGIWFDPHAPGAVVNYYGWPSAPIKDAAAIVRSCCAGGDNMAKRGPDHAAYDHEPNDLDRAMLETIRTFIADHEYSPTQRELATLIGVKSTAPVSYRLKRLMRFGMITKASKQIARSIQIADDWKD